MRSNDEPAPDTAGYFESFDSFAHLVRPGDASAAAARERGGASAVPEAHGPRAAPVEEPLHAGLLYRPTIRRPLALLHVIDDGRDDGEIVRLREGRFVIGRVEGHVVIPHDVLMSPSHAQLERLPEGGWRLSDLGSGTGTFVRVDRARLRHGRTIQVGSTRLCFHEVDLTEAWLVEVTPGRTGGRHECHAPTTTIGRSGCTIALDDPFVDGTHAEVRRTHGGWRIRNVGANGLWVRIDEPVELGGAAQFMCGEQRFVFEPLG